MQIEEDCFYHTLERISGDRVHFLRGLADILLKEKLKKKKKLVLYFISRLLMCFCLGWKWWEGELLKVGGEKYKLPLGANGRLKTNESNADTQPGHGGFGPSFLTR